MTRLHTARMAIVVATACAACADSAAPDPVFELGLEAYDFGEVEVGALGSVSVEVINRSAQNLTLSLSLKSEAMSSPFSFNPTELEVPADTTTMVRMVFTPDAEGSAEDTVQIRLDNDPTQVRTISLRGRGTVGESRLDLSSELISFGDTVVTTTRTQSLTLSNLSAVAIEVSYLHENNLGLCDDFEDTSAFCMRGLPPVENSFTLAAGSTLTLELSFTPEFSGPREGGSLGFRACPSCREQTLRFSGRGVEFGLICNPDPVEIPQLNVGECSSAFVECINEANTPVRILGWDTSSVTSLELSPTPSFAGPPLAEGDRQRIDITYCPTDAGLDTGALVIRTDHSDPRFESISIALSAAGGGPDVRVPTGTIEFGEVALIAPSRRLLFVENVGSEVLTVLDASIDDPQLSVFPSSLQIEPGDSASLEITFQPVAEEPTAATIVIQTDDPDTPELARSVTGQGVNLPPCRYSVTPMELGFGDVQLGRTVVRSIAIRNDGAGDCLLTGAALGIESDPEFSLPSGAPESQRIRPGRTGSIAVAYSPISVGAHRASLDLALSSIGTPFNRIGLDGQGVAAAPLIAPQALDFGQLEVACSTQTAELRIYNVLGTSIELSSIELLSAPNSPFFLVTEPLVPGTLPAGTWTTLQLGFAPRVAGSYAASLQVEGHVGAQPFRQFVSLSGGTAAGARQVESFTQGGGDSKADVLFVVLHTSNAALSENLISDNINAVLGFANNANIDYQIGVLTADISGNAEQGRLVPVDAPPEERIITAASSPSPSLAFRGRLPAHTPTSGFSSTELSPLAAIYFALSAPLSLGHNAGFLRPDASLGIVYVGNDDDFGSGPTEFFLDFFDGLKGHSQRSRVSVSAIAGRPPTGCTRNGEPAFPATRLQSMVDATGGTFETYCLQSWSLPMQNIAGPAFGRRKRFVLEHAASEGSLSVTVDGVSLPERDSSRTNWAHDPATRQLIFNSAVLPTPGAEIDVEYRVSCE